MTLVIVARADGIKNRDRINNVANNSIFFNMFKSPFVCLYLNFSIVNECSKIIFLLDIFLVYKIFYIPKSDAGLSAL